MRRWTVAGGLGAVALTALGLAAVVRPPDEVTTIAATCAILFAASLVAVIRPRRAPGWTGFAVLGWAYLLATFASPGGRIPYFPTTHWLGKLAESIHAPSLPADPPGVSDRTSWTFTEKASQYLAAKPGTRLDRSRHTTGSSSIEAVVAYNRRVFATILVGHCLLCLLLGLLGAIAGRAVAARGRDERPSPGR